MATRWFGPRPVLGSFESTTRHGSCGCCKCGGLDNGTNVFNTLNLDLVNYPAYRDGLRVKLVISGVQDSHSIEIDEYYTDITGMSGLNGTWYLSVERTQYGCIWSADDSELVEISYNIYENYFPYDYTYTLNANIEAKSARPSTATAANFFRLLSLGLIIDLGTFNPDALSPPPPIVHPVLGIEFVPTSDEYRQATSVGVAFNSSRIGWDGARVQDVISGDLRFYKSFFGTGAWGDVISFDDPAWIGIDDFYDTTTSTFKTAGTFTAEIERL